jgi:hypothetical protein
MNNFTTIAVSRLKPHPLLKQTGMLSRLAKREGELAKKGGDKKALHLEKKEEIETHLAALREDVRANGIRKPIQVCSAGDKDKSFHVLDGRHRLEIAEELKLSKVPVEILAKDDAKSVIASATLNKPMSKGAIAYLATLIHPEAATEENRGKSSLSELLTASALADKVGVSKALMSDAVKLFHFFHKTGKRDAEGRLVFVPGAKAKFEDSIFSPRSSLRGVISAVIALSLGEDKPSKSRTPEQKWQEVKRKTALRLRSALAPTRDHFAKLSGEDREQFIEICAREIFAQNEELASEIAVVISGILEDREA